MTWGLGQGDRGQDEHWFSRGFLTAARVGDHSSWTNVLPRVAEETLFSDCSIDLDDSVPDAAIGQEPWLKRMRTIVVRGTFNPQHLLQSPRLTRLKQLVLIGDRTPLETAAIVESPAFSELEFLLFDSDVLNASICLAPRILAKLQTLSFNASYEHVCQLADDSAASGLKQIHLLIDEPWGPRSRSIPQLAGSQHLGGVVRLGLSVSGLSRLDIEDLGRMPFLDNLRRLTIETAYSSGSSSAYSEFLKSPRLANLAKLSLKMQRVKKVGIDALASSPHLRNLNHLNLEGCLLDDACLRALADSPNLANIEYLGLSNNIRIDAGASALAASPYLGRLRYLAIDEQGLSGKAKRLLSTRFGEALDLRRL